jgi:iron complex outermembrane receptor protein
VVNIISRAPTAETSGFVEASAWSDDEQRVRAGVSGTLIPGVARASLNATYGEYDGNVDNLAGGDKVNGYRRQGARARIDITPSADLDISLIADYLRANGSPSQVPYKALNAAFAQGIAPVVAGAENRSIRADLASAIADTNRGLSAQLNWRKAGYTFTSISAWREWDNQQRTSTSPIGNSLDVGRITATYPATRDIGTLDFRQLSQELLVASPRIGILAQLEYVAGLYYLAGEDRETYERIVTTTRTDAGRADYGVRNDSYAAFGEATVHLAPAPPLFAGYS